MSRSFPRALLLLPVTLLTGCQPAEPPEAAQARRMKRVYEDQVAGLEKLVARAEAGERIFNADQLAVGIDEDVVRELLGAALPLKAKVGEELAVELQQVEVFFRWTQAGVRLEGRASSTRFPDVFVAVRLLGALDEMQFEDGRLSARVKLIDAELQGASLGSMGKDLLDATLKAHLGDIEAAIPAFEVPVRLEQGIAIAGLGKGPVSVRPGRLPLQMSVAMLFAGDQRLWVMLDIAAGPWQRAGEAPPPEPEDEPAETPATPASQPGATR